MKKALYILAIPFLMAACAKDGGQNMEQSKAITLTTPAITLNGVSGVVTRSGAENIMESADLYLYVSSNSNPGYRDGRFSYDETAGWESVKTITLNDGPGHYYAGVQAMIDLKAKSDIPAISNAVYAYRGVVEVRENGLFAPDGELNLYSSAVQFILKDHNGALISPAERTYLVTPVGLAQMKGFATEYPKVEQEIVCAASEYPTTDVLSVNGDYTPGVYPATWENGRLETLAQPTSPWKLFKVVYCQEGFDSLNQPLGPFVVWNVQHPAMQLVLEAGKLHTFTITLSNPALATSAVSSMSVR